MPRFSPPLVPDSEEAREWLVKELSREVYSQSPSIWDWLWEKIGELIDAITSYGSGIEAIFLPLVILALIAGIIALAFRYSGPVRRARRSQETVGGIWQGDDTRTAETLRQSAAHAAAAGNFSLAVVEQFRATVRTLEERGTIETTAGMTAGEVAAAISTASPGTHALSHSAATRFNTTLYGGIAASQADYLAMLEFDSASTGLVSA